MSEESARVLITRRVERSDVKDASSGTGTVLTRSTMQVSTLYTVKGTGLLGCVARAMEEHFIIYGENGRVVFAEVVDWEEAT